MPQSLRNREADETLVRDVPRVLNAKRLSHPHQKARHATLGGFFWLHYDPDSFRDDKWGNRKVEKRMVGQDPFSFCLGFDSVTFLLTYQLPLGRFLFFSASILAKLDSVSWSSAELVRNSGIAVQRPDRPAAAGVGVQAENQS